MNTKTLHSILFVAADDHPQVPNWTTFLRNVREKLEGMKGVVPLAGNVWLLDLTVTLDAFSVLLGQVTAFHVRYGILPFAEAPQWLPEGFLRAGAKEGPR